MVLCASLLAIYLLFSNLSIISTDEVVFDRIELMNSTFLEGLYNVLLFRIAKYNRTTYVLNIEVENLVDIDYNHEMEVKFYFNRLNNNQYNLSPIRVARNSYCKTMQKFRPVIMAMASENITNIYNADGSSCPIKKVRVI